MEKWRHPQEFKDASIIHLFRRKWNPPLCDNHRGISLLSVAGKVLARVLLNRLNEHLEQSGLLQESQCGFRNDRGPIDMSKGSFKRNASKRTWTSIWPLLTLLKHLIQSVVRSLENYGEVWLSDKVHSNGEAVPRWYACQMMLSFLIHSPVTNGVKQGCVLAPTLFSMMFSAMLTAAFQDGDNGIPIRYRFDRKLFNLRRLHAESKVYTEVLDEFLFADDMEKGAPTEKKMQKDVDQVCDSCDSYDLTISIKKTINQQLASLTRSPPLQWKVKDHLPWKHIVKSRAHWWWSQCQDCQS